jgi:molecular chaperone DnaK (HSP70)
MKTSELKKMLKEAVKEAIQEELREILLEALKSPKSVVNESYAQPKIDQPKQLTPEERRNMFSGMLSEMQQGGTATAAYAGTMNPTGPVDAINGALPEGQVGLDQIMGLIKK